MKKILHLSFSILLSGLMCVPAYARGFGGGGGGHFGGGGFGHAGGFGGAGGFGHAGGFGGAGGFGHAGGVGGFGGAGGFGHVGGFGGAGGFGHAGGVAGYGGDHSWSGAHEGGFGSISGYQNRTPESFNRTNVSNQATSVRGSFNNDFDTKNFNHVNNVDVNHYGGYGDHGYGYHGYGGYGWHGYGYHPYSYGYHPYGYGWGYPGSWYVPGWSTAAAWTFAGVSTLGTFLGLASLGSGGGSSTSNVTYNNDNVYVNQQPAGSQAQYYQQAQQLAQTGVDDYTPGLATAPNYYAASETGEDDDSDGAASAPTSAPANASDWQSLGVFSLVEPGQTQSNMMMQLAINKSGVLHGNYYNQLTNESSEIYGALDKKTQRVSWTIGTNPQTVFDAGLSDLTGQDSSVLVHYSPTNTQRMTLVRMQQPQAQASAQ